MANPVKYTLTNSWQNVATNITTGTMTFFRRASNSRYLFTVRDTGSTPPANTTSDDGLGDIVSFLTQPKTNTHPEAIQVPISSTGAIDVYVKSTAGEGKVVVIL